MDEWKYQPARDLDLPHRDHQKSLLRENGLLYSACHLTWWSAVKCYLKLWHRIEIYGLEHFPLKPPFVVVANHSSHLDALVLGSMFSWRIRDQIYPIAAGEVFFDSPTTSLFSASMLNALPLWRKKCGPHALEELRQRLIVERCGFILFPEGTRSRDGNMTSFKPGLGMLVAQSDVPVFPCYLQGRHQALPPDKKIPRPRKIQVHIGEAIKFHNISNDRAGWIQITQTLQEQVTLLGRNV